MLGKLKDELDKLGELKDELDKLCELKGHHHHHIIISVFEPVFLYRGLGFLTSLPGRRPLHSERF